MYNSVVKFGKFAGIPAVSCTDQITGDTLYGLELRVAFRTFMLILIRILISAFGTVVAVMVYRSVTHVILVHEVNDLHDRFLVMGGIAVNLHIEDMSAAGHLVVRGLNLRLVTGRAPVIYRHMVGVCVIILVSDSGDDTESLSVSLRELARQSLSRSGKNGIIMIIHLAIVVGAASHMAHDSQT